MKKLFTMILVIIMILPAAVASADQSDEGVLLYPGVWKVGRDIPAGDWTVTPSSVNPRYHYVYILYCDALDESGTAGSLRDSNVWSPVFLTFDTFQKENMYPTFLNMHLVEGRYIIVEDGIVIFTPFEENPDNVTN